MLGHFPTGCLAILFKKNRPLVVLANDSFGHIIALSLQEQPCPQNGRHTVGFSGATGIQLLFCQSRNRITSVHIESATCVASHVGVQNVRPINHPLQNYRSIGTQYYRQLLSSSKILYQVTQIGPIVLVWMLDPCGQERKQRTIIWSGTLGG